MKVAFVALTCPVIRPWVPTWVSPDKGIPSPTSNVSCFSDKGYMNRLISMFPIDLKYSDKNFLF